MTFTVVMPCYNEASRGSGQTSFENRLAMIAQQLAPLDYRVIMVDDGSTDNSMQVFQDFVQANSLWQSWCCLHHEPNQGKGRAVLKGIEAASTDFVLILDADMSVEPYKASQLINGIRDDECYIATRYSHTSQIVNPRTPLRKFISFCCRTLVNLLFGLGVTDSQCGFKMIPRSYCEKLTDFAADSWLYDVEILYHLKCQGVDIREISVRWENMERESTVKAVEAIIPSTKALFSLFLKKSSIRALYRKG